MSTRTIREFSKRDARARGDWQGMNWIRQAKRLAIYLRDGAACVYCGDGIDDGAILTLDHLRPHVRGGGNGATNLVTACKRCNDSRGARTLARFIVAVADYLDHGIDAVQIATHVEACRHRTLDLITAKALIARRGSAFAALRSRRNHNSNRGK
jgi:hypothetical protein